MQSEAIKLVEERLKIVDEYAKCGEKLNELNKLKALWWEGFRNDYKSDASADRAWDLTSEGQLMYELRLKMRIKQMKMSALKSKIEVMRDEARNYY